jgi:hypothetical protein
MSDLSSWLHNAALVGAIKGGVKLAVTGAIAGGTFVLTQAIRRRGEVSTGETGGSTVQSPKILVIGLLCGLLSVAFLIWGLTDPETLAGPGEAMAWVLLVSGFTLGFVVMAVYASHRWEWDTRGLTWHGFFRSAHIPWNELSHAGLSWDGQFVATSTSGRKIRWTNFALEHEAIMRAAQVHLAAQHAGPAAKAA